MLHNLRELLLPLNSTPRYSFILSIGVPVEPQMSSDRFGGTFP